MTNSPEGVEFLGASLTGAAVETLTRRIGDLNGIFLDSSAFNAADPDDVAYSVDSFMPVETGTAGGLFFGVTHLMPGRIAREFYMTKGHFHSNRDRAEFYWGIAGTGFLLLMDTAGKSRTEIVKPGSLHYVPGDTAHRLVNTGDVVLDVGACWPSDAGHEYGVIAETGFSIRVLMGESGPEIISR